jgi:glycerophosphoryl diester phosphodiesterase
VVVPVEIIAHRGASAEAPENSIEAFQRAIDLGCDWIECDVHLSSDGVPVIVHDPIKNLSVSELGLPTLEEVLALDRQGVGLMIELKIDCIDAVLSLIEGEERIVVGSLEPSIVAKIPSNLSLGIAGTNDALQAYREMGLERLAVSHELDVAGAWVWTVDDPNYAGQLIARGATGIITNDPRSLLNALR